MPNRFFIRKAKVSVQLQMTDGVTMKGNVFINIDSRVLDLVNDSATFVPFEAEDGSIHLLNKFEILRLTPTSHKR
ncbi:MAG: hypothetical protein HOM52_07595 [Rhodospirillaceae bacterium]|jgi:hypothetical protein|nr:hypothetical protein [Rhodospirillaceae bacterium]MBT4428616.1 hypothetical protein [Rhodospirillaceae bacterium]MBT5038359.1 hypothetical protein [Rhodospirillaceae bacterium]MBT5677739.1 hypothetical protein [Rhodospirillaceae bacterium]MBT5779927.1 hypothetical protein [Rhodospirillaceae bacterium]